MPIPAMQRRVAVSDPGTPNATAQTPQTMPISTKRNPSFSIFRTCRNFCWKDFKNMTFSIPYGIVLFCGRKLEQSIYLSGWTKVIGTLAEKSPQLRRIQHRVSDNNVR